MTAVSDGFAYSNGALASVSSGAWAAVTGLADCQVLSGEVTYGSTSTVTQSRHTTAMSTDDQYAEVDFRFEDTNTTYREASIMCRVSPGAATFYRLDINPGSSGTLTLYRCNTGTFTQVTQVTGVWGTLDTAVHTIRLEVEGDAIRGYFDGNLDINTTNASIASGAHVGVGVYVTQADRRAFLDSFAGGDLGDTGVIVGRSIHYDFANKTLVIESGV
jgi:hypothetical protein